VFAVFALLTMVAVCFALPTAPGLAAATGIGALWISVLFGALLSLHRSFALELELEALAAIRLTPASPTAVFLGKLLANFVVFAVLEVGLVAAFVVFYNQGLDGRCVRLLGTLLLGTFGLCCVGTLLGALNALVRGNELLLPLLVVPLALPLLLAAVKHSTGIYAPGAGAAWATLRFLAVYAVLFLAAATLLFEHVVED
jgi:heme exporter protein B